VKSSRIGRQISGKSIIGAFILGPILVVSVSAQAQLNFQAPPQAVRPGARVNASAFAEQLRATIERGGRIQIGRTIVDLDLLKRLYSIRGYQPIWIDAQGPLPLARTLQTVLNDMAPLRGLQGSHYWSSDAYPRELTTDFYYLVEYELLLSQGYIHYGRDLATGRINPKDPALNLADIELTRRNFTNFDLLNNAVKYPNEFVQMIHSLEPQSASYIQLMSLLTRLKRAENSGGWSDLRTDVTLRPGEAHPNVPGIRMRLVDFGALPPERRSDMSQVYDTEMARVIKRIQKVHFSTPDGVIGRDTYRILATPLQNRISQVRANLERWRLLPRTFGTPNDPRNRYVFVDLGRQEMDVVENNQLVDRMKVIVGRDLRQTPTMVDFITEVVVNPYWFVPKSIIVRDMIPAMKNDPNYLQSKNIRILGMREGQERTIDWSQYTLESPPPFTFRQDPGPKNSLGVLKFSLTNAHAIYMHDTDNPSLFSREQRYLSSGCIRLERPRDFASYLLKDVNISRNDIDDLIQDPKVVAHKLSLPMRIRTYIVGSTITLYRDGIAAFVEDVYKQDNRIVDALDGRRSQEPVVQATSQVQAQMEQQAAGNNSR
jgi:L,D-transpeptidase YcbB